MNELFNMTFGRIFHLLTSSPAYTLYTFFCTAILCALFQIFFLKKSARKNRVPLSAKHFVRVYIFLLYLAFIFQASGVGTIWCIGKYDSLIRVEEIVLIPFKDFGGIHSVLEYALNIFMMLPFGFLLPLIWPEFRSIKKVVFTGFSFSLIIELSQLLNLRATTIDDLIMNTLGALLGCLIYCCLHRIRFRTNNFQRTRRSLDPIITHEALIYLACAFVGIFFLSQPSPVLSLHALNISNSIGCSMIIIQNGFYGILQSLNHA